MKRTETVDSGVQGLNSMKPVLAVPVELVVTSFRQPGSMFHVTLMKGVFPGLTQAEAGVRRLFRICTR